MVKNVFSGCASKHYENSMTDSTTFTINNKTDIATFGAGCFWCVEAIYQQLKGVIDVESGYSGGIIKNPTYREVSNGSTGHAEVCQIFYNSQIISYDELIEVFFLIHDPTSLNKQGNDVGTQYRSVIVYHNAEQLKIAGEYIQMLNESPQYKDRIVTTLEPYTTFYKAENYHKDYYILNTTAPYCIYVISPKLTKFKRAFTDKIKTAQPLN